MLKRLMYDYAEPHRCRVKPLDRRTLVVINPNLDGVCLGSIPCRLEAGVTIARVRHSEETSVATTATVIRPNDRIAVVGTRAGLDQFERVVGQGATKTSCSPRAVSTLVRVLVTNRGVLGKAIGELDPDDRFSVVVIRATRADMR